MLLLGGLDPQRPRTIKNSATLKEVLFKWQGYLDNVIKINNNAGGKLESEAPIGLVVEAGLGNSCVTCRPE